MLYCGETAIKRRLLSWMVYSFNNNYMNQWEGQNRREWLHPKFRVNNCNQYQYMNIKNYSPIEGKKPLVREKLRYKQIKPELLQLSFHNTIDAGIMNSDVTSPSRPQHATISVSIIKELENVISRNNVSSFKLTRRLLDREKLRARQLEGWSLEGKLWSRPSPRAKIDEILQAVEQKSKQKRKNNHLRNLSLDLYSRMINSFRNSYKTSRRNFKSSTEALHGSENIQKALLPNKIKHKQVLDNIIIKKSIHSPSLISLTPVEEPLRDRVPQIASGQQFSQYKSSLDNAVIQKTANGFIKVHEKSIDRPWRTNSKFPKIQVIKVDKGQKRNYTPWRGVEEVDDDIMPSINY